MIKLIAFDADDTLWDCQSHFVEVEQRYCQLLADYADEQTVSHELFKTETANMAELGYGCKAFTLSLVENAVKISQGRIPANLLLQIQDLGRSLLRFLTFSSCLLLLAPCPLPPNDCLHQGRDRRPAA